MEKLVIVGLGYVGLPLAVEFAKSRRVIGFDISMDRVCELRKGFDHTGEIDADDLQRVGGSLMVTSDRDNLRNASIYIVTVPTPIDEGNQPDFSPLISACEMIGPYLREGAIVVFESTVYPGCTREFCVPILEKYSGMQCEDGISVRECFAVGYSPERINPGDKLHRLPDIVKLVSASSPRALEILRALYGEIISAGVQVVPSIEVAEAAKVIENVQRDLNIAFVNELSQIFSVMNLETEEVLKAARTKWNFLDFRPGLVGGHCIGIDPYYLAYGAVKAGCSPDLILAGRKVNSDMAKFIAAKIVKSLSKMGKPIYGSRIGIAGLTFKENCPDLRNSKVFDVIAELREWGCEIIAFDPFVTSQSGAEVLEFTIGEISEFTYLDAIAILVPHDFFVTLMPADIEEMSRPNEEILLFDLKCALNCDVSSSRVIRRMHI